MIDANRKNVAEKPTENVEVSRDAYNELKCVSTKVDIVVDLMCHGTLMADDVLAILNCNISLPDKITFEDYIRIPTFLYDDLLNLRVRFDALLDMLEKHDYLSTGKILRTLGTELALEEADKLEKEKNERLNNK